MTTRALELCRISLADNQIVSLVFTGPRLIQQINRDYVGHQGLTDVISFDYFDDESADGNAVMIELFICLDKAKMEGDSRADSSYAEEVVLYLVHGLLHAAGEDDLDPVSRKQMRKREKQVMTQLKQEFDFALVFPE